MKGDPSSSDDILDIRDLIERFEELESEHDDFQLTIDDEDASEEDREEAKADLNAWLDDNAGEFEMLKELLDSMAGYGGDHKWRGHYYPSTLIRDSYFPDHARELASDIGAIRGNECWPLNCIDWEQAAHELRMDYSSVEFDNVTYWYRG